MSAEMTLTYSVPEMSCEHCKAAVTAELSAVDGVDDVEVDLGSKLVRISGSALDDGALRAAIDEAGYEAVEA